MTDLMTYGVANIQLNHPLNLSGCARPKLCSGVSQQLSFAFHLTSLLSSSSYFLLPTTGLLVHLCDATTFMNVAKISTVSPLINIVAKSYLLDYILTYAVKGILVVFFFFFLKLHFYCIQQHYKVK